MSFHSYRKNPLDEGDSDDDLISRRFPMKSKTPLAKNVKQMVEKSKSIQETQPRADFTEEEDDPLEAFMQGVDAQAAAEKIQAEQSALEIVSKGSHSNIMQDEPEEDGVDAYVKFLESKAKGNRPPESADAEDSEEEVYRVALEMEQQIAEKGHISLGDDKREIDPLKPIDHSSIQYIEIEKDFYEEHPAITALSVQQVIEFRKKHNICVNGIDVPKPCISFAHFGFDEELIAAISRNEFTTPTPIQSQAIPIVMSGRDIIGIAATGSGKTLAYLWPSLVHMMDQPELEKGQGPIGLILSPTRELALQIMKEAKRYANKVYGIRVFSLTGGANKADQWKALRAGVDLLIATPGRLIEMIKNKATNLQRVSYLVLDEADRMLEQGFEAQVLSICNHIRPDRQALLFSATFPKKVEMLASYVTNDPVKVVVGGGVASQDVQQIVKVLNDEEEKISWVLETWRRFVSEGSVLLFATKKTTVDSLVERLQGYQVPCVALHGGMLQPERVQVLSDLHNRKPQIVISTDVFSRGIDIRGIKTVICFDPPRDQESHTHRVGRTGRAGEKGIAYVLVTREQHNFAAELVPQLEAANQEVPQSLMEVAMKNNRFAKMRRRFGSLKDRGGHLGRQGRGSRGSRGRGARGRGQGLGGGSRFSGEPTVLSTTGLCASSTQSANILMSAFRPSSRPSEKARPSYVPMKREHESPSPPRSAPPSDPVLPDVSENSSNPLLAAFAKHKAKLMNGSNN